MLVEVKPHTKLRLRQRRKTWARRIRNWAVPNWRQVIFSDEFLDIMETVWNHIMHRLLEDPPSTVDELRLRVRQYWKELTANYLKNL